MSQFLKPLYFTEFESLQVGLEDYFTSLGKRKAQKTEKIKLIRELTNKYEHIFSENKFIKEKIESSKKNLFHFNDNDCVNVYSKRNEEDFIHQRKKVGTIKLRLLIFSLEVEGFYDRPIDKGENYLHTAMMDEVYKKSIAKENGKLVIKRDNDSTNGMIQDKVANELIGTYQLFRLSFNNSFPGFVSAQTLRIYRDKEENEILKYKSFNSYKQYQSHDQDKGLNRIRVSSGYLYNYQGQILFSGGTAYSHLDETEAKPDDYGSEHKSAKVLRKYPDIMLMHHHSGDTKNIRGIVLGQYPFLNLPVATTLFMSKVDSQTALELDNLSSLDPKEYKPRDICLLAKFYGNINPGDSETEINIKDIISYLDETKFTPEEFANIQKMVKENRSLLIDKVKKVNPFISNKIEKLYSNMLTP